MDASFLGQLISAGAKSGLDGIRQELARSPAQVTPENAAGYRRLAADAQADGNFQGAFMLFQISAELWDQLGDRTAGLSDRLSALEVQSWNIQSADRLQNNAAVAAVYQEIAEKLGNRVLASWAALLQAECWLFSGTYTGPGESAARLTSCLEATIGFFKTLQEPVPAGLAPRVTDLIAALASALPSDQAVDQQADLAMGIVIDLPDPVPFPEDPEQGYRAAQAIAWFLDAYGPFGSANRHWQYAMHGARELADFDWLLQLCQSSIQVLSNRCSEERQRGEVTPWELALCRSHLRLRMEWSRGRLRSRAGRRWFNTRYDRLRGTIVKDDLQALAESEGGDFNERYTILAAPVKAAPPGLPEPSFILPISADVLFEAMEGAKARLLLDWIEAGPHPPPDAPLQDRILAHERELLQLPAAAGDGLQDDPLRRELNLCSLFIGPVNVAEGAPLPAQLVDLEKLEHEENAGLSAASGPKPLEAVRGALAEDELLIAYSIPSEELHPAHFLYILALSKKKGPYAHRSRLFEQLDATQTGWVGGMQAVLTDTDEVILPLVQNSWLITAVVSTRLAIQREEPEADGYLEKFYELLVRPIADAGLLEGIRKLIFVPHGPLRYLPFGALRQPDGRYLVQDFVVTHQPSASIWSALSARTCSQIDSFVGFANPTLARQDLKILKESARELRSIGLALSAINPETFLEDKATEEAALQHLSQHAILHFSTHGEFMQHDADDGHRILLAPGQEQDGNLEAQEIRGLDLSAAQLVVLSICSGGLIRFAPGDEPLGLMPAFLSAGARSVLAPLWAVDDGPTRWFFAEFYKHLLEAGPGESLRQAQLQFIQDGRALRHWCGFVLVGPSGWGILR